MRSTFRMDLKKQFQAETSMMLALLDSAKYTTRHSTIFGVHNETILIDFLRRYLPSRFTVSQGQVVDPLGHLSPQCDIIIHDQTTYPPAMIFANGAKVVYVHAAFAVIEVKTTLTTGELSESIENFECIREREFATRRHFLRLPQFQEESGDAIMDAIENDPETISTDMRIHKFLFAFRCNRKPDSIVSAMQHYSQQTPHRQWPINKVCVLRFRDSEGDILGPHIRGLEDSRSYSKGENTLVAFFRTLFNALCLHPNPQTMPQLKTQQVLEQYNPWGLRYP